MEACILELRRIYPAFKVDLQLFCSDDGTESRLVTISGSLTVKRGGGSSGINRSSENSPALPPVPIEIFLLPEFPKKLPYVYVRPPPQYAISASKYIDVNGLVDLARLGIARLSADHFAVISIIQVLTSTFNTTPPMFDVQHCSAAACGGRIEEQIVIGGNGKEMQVLSAMYDVSDGRGGMVDLLREVRTGLMNSMVYDEEEEEKKKKM